LFLLSIGTDSSISHDSDGETSCLDREDKEGTRELSPLQRPDARCEKAFFGRYSPAPAPLTKTREVPYFSG
jgi:hypothetical protein